jgi:hypothetical protein
VIVHRAGFFTVSAAVIVAPGLDAARTIRNSLTGGRRAGLCTGAAGKKQPAAAGLARCRQPRRHQIRGS